MSKSRVPSLFAWPHCDPCWSLFSPERYLLSSSEDMHLDFSSRPPLAPNPSERCEAEPLFVSRELLVSSPSARECHLMRGEHDMPSERSSPHGSLFSLSSRQETGLSLLIVSICVASR
jgi:hypothetical protein